MTAQRDRDYDSISIIDIPNTQASRCSGNLENLFKPASQDVVQEEIENALRSSDFVIQAQQKRLKLEQKMKVMITKLRGKQADKKAVQEAEDAVKKLLFSCSKEHLFSRIWVHFRIDSLFVSSELLERQDLVASPVAIGNYANISFLNEAARFKGIRQGMAGSVAQMICPELTIIDYNFTKYKEISDKMKDVLRKYDPDLESLSLEEASLDLTNYINENDLNDHSIIIELCFKINQKIKEDTRLDSIFGIAPNKLLCRLVSELNSNTDRNESLFLEPNVEAVREFIKSVPINRLSGISESCIEILQCMKIVTCSDILEKPVEVYHVFPRNTFEYLIKSASGLSRCYHELPADRKTVNVSRAFKVISKQNEMEEKVKELAKMMSEDLSAYHKMAKQFSLVLKTHTLQQKQKTENIDRYSNDVDTLLAICIKLLRSQYPLEPLRSITLKAGNLIDEDDYQSAMDKQMRSLSMRNPKSKPKLRAEGSANQLQIKGSESNTNASIIMQEEKVPTEFVSNEFSKANQIKDTSVQSLNKLELELSEQNSIRSVSNFSAINNFDDRPREMYIAKSPMENSGASVLQDSKKIVEEKGLSQQLSNADSNNENNEVYCPICNVKFETAWNRTRVNKHIDQCLISGNASSMGNSENFSTSLSVSTSRREEPRIRKAETMPAQTSNVNFPNKFDSEETRTISLKRKIEPAGKEERTRGRKPKKYDDIKNNVKLDAFFRKKN